MRGTSCSPAAIVGAVTGFAVAGFERLTVNVVFDSTAAHLPLVVFAFLPGHRVGDRNIVVTGAGHGLSSATADEYLDSFHDGRPFSCVILRIA